jgi:Protein of unknown function (DUF4065)
VKLPKPSSLHFHFPVERSTQRFRELIIYVAKQCENDPNFGATKLNKILYHSDFRAFERFGTPLTGVVYFRLMAGPAPKALLPIQRELVSEGAIRVDTIITNSYPLKKTIALRAPVISHFSEDELLLVDEVIRELWPQTAGEVSDASHDVRWRTLNNQDHIPYEFAFLGEGLTEDDERKTNELAAELGW